MLKWIDAHCHLTDPGLGNWESLLLDAEAHGVAYFLQGGVQPSEWRQQEVLAQKYPAAIGLVFGVHPWQHPGYKNAVTELELRLQESGNNVVALGEMGLDYHTARNETERSEQRSSFRSQLALAKTVNKPIVIHCVKAHNDILAILKELSWQGKGLVHGFTSSLQVAKSYAERGLAVGIGPRFLKARSFRSFATWQDVPWVLESDAPFQGIALANPLVTVVEVARQLAENSRIPIATINRQANRTFADLFR